MTAPNNDKKNVLGRGMNRLRGLEALTSAMSKPMPLDSSFTERVGGKDQVLATRAENESAATSIFTQRAPQGLGVENQALDILGSALPTEVDTSAANVLVPTHSSIGDISQDYQIVYLRLSSIISNPLQPRRHFGPEELEDLVESIEKVGVLQPIVVRPLGTKYEIVAGERRWRAAQEANLERLPAIVRELQDIEAFQLALIENVQRQQLNPIEEARGYQRLIEEFKMTQEEVSAVVGKKRASIANTLRLLHLDVEVVALLETAQLSQGHAKVILSVRDKAAQRSLGRRIVSEGLSVRAVEKILPSMFVLDSGRAVKQSLEPVRETKSVESEVLSSEILDKLRLYLGTRVRIQTGEGKKGKIVIEYFSEQELDRLVELICSSKAPFEF
jgi:ParB family chromosome partitioning protein